MSKRTECVRLLNIKLEGRFTSGFTQISSLGNIRMGCQIDFWLIVMFTSFARSTPESFFTKDWRRLLKIRNLNRIWTKSHDKHRKRFRHLNFNSRPSDGEMSALYVHWRSLRVDLCNVFNFPCFRLPLTKYEKQRKTFPQGIEASPTGLIKKR